MPVNDPVGDMLTRLRNASRARHDKVVIPHSKLKVEVIKVLKDEGYIGDFTIHELAPQSEISVQLKYGPDRSPAITGIHRVSKPGLRRYVTVREIPQVLGGMGISILSTSRGILVDTEARKQKVGGELLCKVY
ncbi:30S ribosomal protein S8 [Corallococcus praedator]|uniref:Small ribosomal subunit protein uS8 n=2 Tax=Corallococcus TaxID=83461 RepID=A0ABR9PYB0_9BACT|nr:MULTISPECIES: 30S ribosomal protein S8 [Corallococcus]MBE4752910.1 30S ribosomal protein S8 [Corallococcus soli]MCY1032525.1 30S ribosomal protein S8 [Corallococcus sp. BB11-1]RKH18996.1 30S ribosomal protein S8 [Corallococcus sp. CA047B]RKH35172.1 30S ribosomal protein S8 [Corallococcus sp. CA031C]RKI03103.1 30S ribosomal protein S8 [Corallococcus praedator]